MFVLLQADRDVHETAMTFLRYADNASDMTPAMERVGDDLRYLARLQFDTEGALRPSVLSEHGMWAPLSAPYEAWKLKHNLDVRIGHSTKRLRRSYTTKRHPDHVEQATTEGIVFGSTTPYSGPFNAKRPILPTTTADVARWAKIVQQHILGTRR
jgi:hypothetical protein